MAVLGAEESTEEGCERGFFALGPGGFTAFAFGFCRGEAARSPFSCAGGGSGMGAAISGAGFAGASGGVGGGDAGSRAAGLAGGDAFAASAATVSPATVPTSTLFAAHESGVGGGGFAADAALERADQAPTTSACSATDASSAEGKRSRVAMLTVAPVLTPSGHRSSQRVARGPRSSRSFRDSCARNLHFSVQKRGFGPRVRTLVDAA